MDNFLNKQKKFINSLSFKNKAIYRILFIDNSPSEMINEILNPMIMKTNINKTILIFKLSDSVISGSVSESISY